MRSNTLHPPRVSVGVAKATLIDGGSVKGRSQVVASIQRYLVRRGLPRIQMTLIVTATGLAGFGACVVLLQLGISSMPVRYSLAVVIAYAIFLLLVRLWAGYQRRGIQADPDTVDLLPELMPVSGSAASPEPSLYGGGTFGGGGAQRAWLGSGPSANAIPMHELPNVDSLHRSNPFPRDWGLSHAVLRSGG
jgi:hypothetical protein